MSPTTDVVTSWTEDGSRPIRTSQPTHRPAVRRLLTGAACVVALSACTGDDDAAPPAQPPACAFVDESTVREVLGDDVNDSTDAGTMLHGTSDLLGCQWATPVGTALTVTVTRIPSDDPAGSVDDWVKGCTTPVQPLQLEDAEGGICQDTAFGVRGSELFAVWSGDEMIMRLGLRRDGGAEPRDVDLLRAVAADVTANVTPAGFDEVEQS